MFPAIRILMRKRSFRRIGIRFFGYPSESVFLCSRGKRTKCGIICCEKETLPPYGFHEAAGFQTCRGEQCPPTNGFRNGMLSVASAAVAVIIAVVAAILCITVLLLLILLLLTILVLVLLTVLALVLLAVLIVLILVVLEILI